MRRGCCDAPSIAGFLFTVEVRKPFYKRGSLRRPLRLYSWHAEDEIFSHNTESSQALDLSAPFFKKNASKQQHVASVLYHSGDYERQKHSLERHHTQRSTTIYLTKKAELHVLITVSLCAIFYERPNAYDTLGDFGCLRDLIHC